MQTLNPRQERGQAIAQVEANIFRVDGHLYRVKSQSQENKQYTVRPTDIGWTCTCPDFKFRIAKCKHIWAVEFSIALRRSVEVANSKRIIQPVNVQACPSCQSDLIVKHGVRHNQYGDIQQFLCKNCGRAFVVNLGFEKMRASPQIITSAMQLYFSGESLRNTQKFLKLQGVEVSHVAVLKWIRKYVSLMQKYVDQITPNVSDTWRADEVFIKVKGNMKYLFALMDNETRFWIAQQVTDNKGSSDIRPLFQRGKELARKKPDILITDGARNFQQAYKKELWEMNRTLSPIHIRTIRLAGHSHNNKMERMNGEVRDREKVMRGLKKEDSAILKGYQIYHNFIRKHEGLEGKTPAEASGIEVEGENKWITIIQNATTTSQNPKPNLEC